MSIFDENFKLNILNLNLDSPKEIVKDSNNFNLTRPIDNPSLVNKKSKKDLTLDDILKKFSTKKIFKDKNKDNQIGSYLNEEIDYLRDGLSNNNNINSLSQKDSKIESSSNSPQENNDKKGFENKNNEEGISALENLFTHVPVPFFLEPVKNMRIEPTIQKCYSTKKNKNLILKRIDRNFNLILENEGDETLEYKTYQTDVLQYNIKRKGLFFSYYCIVSNSINGSVFMKTNKQVKKIDLQEMDNNLTD